MDLNFQKKDNKWISDVFISVYGAALHITQEKKGKIQVYANATGMSSRLIASVNSINEIFQLNVPNGLEMTVQTEYAPTGKLITE